MCCVLINSNIFTAMKITKERAISILLVDDDAIDRELFIDALSALSIKCTVTEASGGNEALERLKEQKPTVVMLDLNMPMKDGRQTLREIKADKNLRDIPIIIFSTSNSQHDITESYSAGAWMFIEKPHDFAELSEMLRCLLVLISKYTSFSVS